MKVTLESIDLETVNDAGTHCGCCHRPIQVGAGVTFGRPSLRIPAINVCRRCVQVAAALVGPEPTVTREGRC